MIPLLSILSRQTLQVSPILRLIHISFPEKGHQLIYWKRVFVFMHDKLWHFLKNLHFLENSQVVAHILESKAEI